MIEIACFNQNRLTDHTHSTAIEVKACFATSVAENFSGSRTEQDVVFANFMGKDYDRWLDIQFQE